MLDWLSSSDEHAQHDGVNDGPETPAHIFAARAFKSALFGTPAPLDTNSRRLEGLDLANPVAINSIASPAKGILLTPGTVTAKRKTVTFGGTGNTGKYAADDQSNNQESKEEQALKGSEAGISASTDRKPVTVTASRPIRRSLFNQPKKFGASGIISAPLWSVPENELIATEEATHSTQNDGAADLTVDLQQPRSVSGKHWMQEYKRDHALSKAEMKKLIKYSQNAKSQASEREEEVMKLRDELGQSQDRVRKLETQVAKLSRAEATINGTTNGLAKDAPMANSKTSGPPGAELQTLRKVAAEATAKAKKLEQENESFRRTILHVKDEMARYESRNKQWIEQRRKKDERHTAQRKALKEKVVAYRTRLQEEFDAFQAKTTVEQARLMREIELLRKDLSLLSPEKEAAYCKASDVVDSSGFGSGEQLRQLLSRNHERSPERQQQRLTEEDGAAVPEQMKRRAESGISRQKPAKSALQRLRDETQRVASGQELTSSPTILESHIQHASRKSLVYQNDCEEGEEAKEHSSIVLERKSPKHTLIPYSLNEVESDEEGGQAYDLPIITKHRTIERQVNGRTTMANSRPARKEHRVRSRHGLTGGRHATTAAPVGISTAAANTNLSSTGLTPEREAAARLRIAQRSVEKQKSRRSLFGAGTDTSGRPLGGKENIRRSGGILSERQLNRL